MIRHCFQHDGRMVSILCFLLFMGGQLLAHNVPPVIKGKVITTDGRPAPYVTVQIKGSKKAAVTAEDGSFVLRGLPAGSYTLELTLVGYETQTETVTVSDGEITDLTITIKLSEKQLEEVTVRAGGNRYKANQPSNGLRLQTPLLEVPQNIQVVSSKLLADQQSFDMLESVTRNVSGVMRVEHWDNYARINMRGSNIAAFRNGMNVTFPFGPLTEDMSMVDRIEFVKGPAGFMMANGEPGGMYNVVTKKPTGISKGEATLTLGSFDTYRSTLDLDGKLSQDGKLLYRVNLMGQFKGSHRENDYNNRYSIVPVLKYQFNDQTSLTAEYTYQFSRMSTIGSSYVFSPKGYADLPVDASIAEGNIDPTNIKDQSLLIILNHHIDHNWKLTAQAAYYNYRQRGSSYWYDSIKANGDLYRNLGIWDADGESKMAQVFVNGDLHTGAITHRILAGLDVSTKQYVADYWQTLPINGATVFNIYNPVHDLAGPDVPVFDRSQPLRHRAGVDLSTTKQSYTAGYVQDELRFWHDKIRLTLAGRITNTKDTDWGSSTDETKFTPRVGLSVSVNKDMSVYALYDQAFMPQAGSDFNGKAFDPITGNNIEAGIKNDWFNGRWNSTVTAYQIIRNNVLTTDPEHPNFSTQLGQTTTKGVEVDIRGQIVKGLDAMLNYAFTDSYISKDNDKTIEGNATPGHSKHINNAWLSYRVPRSKLRGLGVSLGYQWLVKRYSWYVWDGSEQGLPNYFRVDGAISYQGPKFSVAFNLNNILNEYLYSGSPYGGAYYWQTEMPRNFRLTVGYRW